MKHRYFEKCIECGLCFSALLSVLITVAVVVTLIWEAGPFFATVGWKAFLTDTQWTPLFSKAHFGILPLLSATCLVACVASLIALPIGTLIAIYLSEFVNRETRELMKPILELLGGIPTVVYGLFALLYVTPLLQTFIPTLPGFNMLSASIVIGIMIIPYVSSIVEDAMQSVPMHAREASLGLGATVLQTALFVVFPMASSGISASYMLAISRTMGETMIVVIAAGMQPTLTWNPLKQGETIASYIVQAVTSDISYGSIGYNSVFAAGFSLFVMTMLFSLLGHVIRRRIRRNQYPSGHKHGVRKGSASSCA